MLNLLIRKSICLLDVRLLLLLTLNACSSVQNEANLVQNEAKQVKLNEVSEEVVMKSILLRDRCREKYPSLKNKIDESFLIFRKENQSYFDSAERDTKFHENLLNYRRFFSNLSVSEAECQKLTQIFLSFYKQD